MMIGALGVTAANIKGAPGRGGGLRGEASVIRHLISGLRDGGLGASDSILFVLDGGKALTRAVRDVFGELAVIARCTVHNERINTDRSVAGPGWCGRSPGC